MTLCPVAIAVGCKRCPIFSVCPVKSVIGDFKEAEPAQSAHSGKNPPAAKKKTKPRAKR